MSDDFVTFRDASGRAFGLVPTSRMCRWDEAAARAALEAGRDDPESLLAIATLHGFDGTEVKDAIAFLAKSIASGRIVAVIEDSWRRPGRPMLRGGEHEGDWSDAVSLASLREQEPTIEYGWVSIELVDAAGVPFAGTEVTLVHADGRRDRVVLDTDGKHRAVRVVLPGPSRVVLASPLEPPARPPGSEGRDGFARRADDISVPHASLGSIALPVLDRHWRLVVESPLRRCTVVTLDGWIEARSVLVFGTMRVAEAGALTVRAALREALAHAQAAGSESTLHVIGHADTEGNAADNAALALERARSLWFYLRGDRNGWGQHAFDHADVATLQASLKWAAVACAVPTDPGPIDGDWGPATAAALDGLRAHAGIDPATPLGPDDWAAIFDLYDDDLARLLLLTKDGLAQLRAGLTLAEPVTMGEAWPASAPGVDDLECPDNRRVELVFCAPGHTPQGDRTDVYDGRFVREHLAARPEVRFQLFVHSPALVGLGGAAADIEIDGLGTRRVRASATGLVEFTVLRGDRVRVTAARRADGSGSVLEFAEPELGRFA